MRVTRAASWGLALAWIAAAPAAAQRPALPAFTGYVVDQAGVIDAEAAARITAMASRLDRAGTAQLAVATLPSLGDASVEEAAVELFAKWGLGHSKERSDGVLILYVPGPPGQRKTRVEVGYGLEGVLPDGTVAGLIREHSSPHVRDNRFGDAAVALTTAIAQIIDADAAAGGDTARPAGAPTERRRSWPWVSLAMGALFVLLFASFVRDRFPGRLHAAGAVLLGGASIYALATASGLAGFVVFAVGLFVNGVTWRLIAGHRCAACGGWADTTRDVVQEATLEAEGLARVTRRCRGCLDASVTDEILPRKTPDTSSGDSSGDGSWSSGSDSGSDFSGGGGGESGGGGASSSD